MHTVLKNKEFGESFHAFDSWLSTCSLNVSSDEAQEGDLKVTM